ncbi:hypothetical protein G5S34_17540 [Herbaspirillum frisingense]|uniref:hypothetical protein n=1 Tax=Herbaspirillum frisingense TaxID=92645 RepID=UPI001601610A|nr:hypothetical protein [Herbaspirillum frisingense]QNB08377.1 hypothetical protein G5S34_17540 [Herbaspirillum frisingense]
MNHQHLIDWRAGVDTANKPRPTVSRLRRRAVRLTKRCAMLALYGSSFAAGVIIMLIVVQEALRAPLTTIDPTEAPVVAPAPKGWRGA